MESGKSGVRAVINETGETTDARLNIPGRLECTKRAERNQPRRDSGKFLGLIEKQELVAIEPINLTSTMKPRSTHRRVRQIHVRASFGRNGRQNRREGFTFVELLAVLGTVALLLAVAMPLLAGNRSSSDRAACQSNLRQIGRAMNMWADDHGGRFQYRVPGSEGGVADSPFAINAWYQFYGIRAELVTPKILVCPTDVDKIPAVDWSNTSNGGFARPDRRNLAVSYVLGLGTEYDPRGFLSGDRNVQLTEFSASGCISSFYSGTPSWNWQSPTLDWTDKLHNRSGNILLNDGSVLSAGQNELKTAVKHAVRPGASTLCVIYPN